MFPSGNNLPAYAQFYDGAASVTTVRSLCIYIFGDGRSKCRPRIQSRGAFQLDCLRGTVPYRSLEDEGNWQNNNINAERTKGKSGLITLGSLLVAMEANNFVITTKSNWSLLMNELRENVVEPRCKGCTQMVDLRPFE
jgi:hypothetical protein